MRIATANMFDTSIATLQRRQQQMQDSQQRLTSGKRIEQASDDPTGASRAERSLSAIGRIDANQRALEASRNSMTLTESALGDANEIMQQVRESMVAAGNASYTDTERRGLADKIAGLRDQLLAIANRPDGGGGFLFGGQGSAEPPFLDQPGGVSYTGVPGQISTGNVDDFPLTVDGRAVWEQARSGNGTFVTEPLLNAITNAPGKSWIDAGRVINPGQLTGNSYQVQVSGSGPAATYTVTNTDTGAVVAAAPFASGKSIEFDGMAITLSGTAEDGDQFTIAPATPGLKVFDVLDRAVSELRTPLRSGVQIAQSNSGRVRDLDAVIANLQGTRSQVGERMNNLDGTESRMADLKLYNQSEQSAAEDLDMVQGISEFQNQQSGYDAALKTYAMVQRMSLFQYINS
jgi:flagellar hook-associated protein 3 FlgL